jgi:trans-2,3-dihydro-3-hydroxyanthranilate isomerase
VEPSIPARARGSVDFPPVRLAFRLLDVFTEVPFAGNQLCVVPEPPASLGVETMQAVAREIHFSETTFVGQAGGDRYRMRIFTPDEELPFAGHPTIGTAYLLVSEGRVAPRAVQTTEAGDVPVEVDLETGFAWMRQLPPAFGPIFEDRALVAAAAGLEATDLRPGLPIQPVSTGLAHLMVPVLDEATLRRAERDGRLCGETGRRAGTESIYLFAVRGAGDVMARMFDVQSGIGEDPATGSAAGPLGAYLATNGLAGMPGRMVVAQGEMVGRPSFLHVEVAPDQGNWTVRVGGGVRIVGEGTFEL